MNIIDWIVLFGTLLSIVIYGVYKTRGSQNIESYLLGDKSMKWWTIGLSVMATQASAITFLSTPGQAFEDGMRFIQFYFSLPLAMVVLSVTVIPLYYRLKVYTAYEYLETRFDLKTRTLAALLFLIQRGLAAGITIYAPAIILSSILGWPLTLTNLIIGLLVIIYTVSGGTRAVSQTQKQQMAVMMGGMVVALLVLIWKLPEGIGFSEAVEVAGNMGKLHLVDLSLDFEDRYTLWSGMLGSFFLFLSYFGTDQSQVQRYISGKSITESRLGLLMNGLVKIPMQFLILFIGAMVFVFFQFYQPPVFFNEAVKEKIVHTVEGEQLAELEEEFTAVFLEKRETLAQALRQEGALARELYTKAELLQEKEDAIRMEVKEVIVAADPLAEPKDTDYVFITFIMNYLPHGLIGLLLAVIFSAAMSSTAGELNALASTTTVDIYKRSIKKEASEVHYLQSSKLFTVLWGLLAIAFATYATLLDNLIEAVNILGSLFYGSILGIFLVAFYIKRVKSNAVFYAALLAEAFVVICYFTTDLAFLWLNPLGCGVVIILGLLFQELENRKKVKR
ncbi:sodium:solute symporter [Nafulsella turpanensis]|uniref:sodium:solute symporter n=1 Tax=Nafulsella turpanensis TaxID=1265690 RepID=UPI00034B3991|nr:sodium:solute symporter [Nafulsella turpanensis]